MIHYLWKAARGYRFCPWRSPYLRWRIETYWGWHTERIGFRKFWSFLWAQRNAMLRFLRWVDRMDRRRRSD